MSKFDGMWKFANEHPFIFCSIVGTAVNGAVGIVRAFTNPFVKETSAATTEEIVSACVKAVNDILKKPDKEDIKIVAEVEPVEV